MSEGTEDAEDTAGTAGTADTAGTHRATADQVTGDGGADDGRGAAITLRVDQNEYLPAAAGRAEMHAIVRVEARGLGPAAARAAASEVIVIDCSGSMTWPPTKIMAARKATVAAVSALRKGTRFAVVQGTERAEVVYPPTGGMAVAGPDTKAAASRAAMKLAALGGTAIGTWLDLARRLHSEQPTALRHTLLLTDGKNEHEDPGELARVLDACAPSFTCDARGIGDGWDATELKEIVRRLRGRADAVLDHSDLPAEFEALTRGSMARALAALRIRIRTRAGGAVSMVKQVYPTRVDLTDEGARPDPRTWEWRSGPWGDEVREYQVCVTADPEGDAQDEEIELAWVELALDGASADSAPADSASAGRPAKDGRSGPGAADIRLPAAESVLVRWTDDPLLSSRIHPRLAHYGADDALGLAVTAAYDAYVAGEPRQALTHWGRAVRLAHELGNEKMLDRLRGLVDIVEAATGEVRLRERIRPLDLNSAMVLSDESSRFRGPGPGAADPAGPVTPAMSAMPPGPDLECPNCGRMAPATAAFCQQCDTTLRPDGPGAPAGAV
ncbi:VWA domain-containing protein [Streptomyces sp. NBS 14/10]|uniref:VWA domain-containing protein n=1 Tax=Streptomyces sp. NBS 14/10 TaxID=1945643 RepID=UPI000B7D6F75|nr:VWA domain-containing protein [Streptomyces sp. NBS 14/10]KAK1179850.1 VWA domain-containing protein [Streptomyces sp. NBS 14/10]